MFVIDHRVPFRLPVPGITPQRPGSRTLGSPRSTPKIADPGLDLLSRASRAQANPAVRQNFRSTRAENDRLGARTSFYIFPYARLFVSLSKFMAWRLSHESAESKGFAG